MAKMLKNLKNFHRRVNVGMLFDTSRQTLKLFWKIDRFNLLLYVAMIFVQVSTSLGALFITGRVINQLVAYLQHGTGTRGHIVSLVIFGAALGILEQIALRIMQFIVRRSYYNWHTYSTTAFNKKISSLDIQYFEDRDFNNTLNKLRQDGHSYKPGQYAYAQLSLFQALIRTISSGLVIIRFAPWMLILIFLALIPSLIVQQMESKLRWGIWGVKGDVNRRFWKVNDILQQKDNIKEVRIMGLRPWLLDYGERMLEDFTSEQRRALGKFIWPALLVRIFEGVIVGGIELWLILKVLARNSGFGIGNYTFYSGVISQFNANTGLVISTLADMYENMLFMKDYYAFLEVDDLVLKPTQPIVIAKNAKPTIEFRGVSFKYPSSSQYVFKDMNITIPYGEHIALVGENGAGKTTLINLLLRFYDVTEGQILIDGHDIRSIEMNSWYRHVGALFQTFNRYPFDIADNIRFGRVTKKYDETDMLLAAKDAGVDQITEKLPYGFKTILDNSFKDGVEPSGGQWQRVALARAFYRSASILILDEPTSAIDAKAEYEIFEQLNKTQKDKTTIIVSHRFSTVRNANKIYVIAAGRIVENGTHEELMKVKNGIYKKMFELQAEGYR